MKKKSPPKESAKKMVFHHQFRLRVMKNRKYAYDRKKDRYSQWFVQE